jgi:hypothetical protein
MSNLSEVSGCSNVTGVVEIQAQCYGGTTYSVYVDDITITQG